MAVKFDKKVRNKWENLYSSVSLDGFHYIFETRGMLRLFWSILVLTSFVLAIILFYGVLADFFQHKTTTQREEIFQIRKIQFPTITICNMNSMSQKKLQQSTLQFDRHELIEFYQQIREGKVDLHHPETQHMIKELKEINITTVEQIISMFELSMNEMTNDPITKALTKHPCTFKGESCTSEDFVPVVSETYGLCFQFHSFYGKDRLHAEDSGEGSGLHLYLNIHEEELVVSRVPYQGLTIFIHPLGTPFEGAVAKSVPVRPGSMSFIHIRLNYHELLPAPYHSNCSTKPYKYVKSNVPYSQSMCSVDCAMEEMMTRCGCVALEVSYHTTTAESCPIEKLECIEKIIGNMTDLLRTCRQKSCPPECNMTKYFIDSAQTTLGNKVVLDRLVNLKEYNFTKGTAREYLRHNVVGIDVAYSDFVFSKETISATHNWVSVLSAIGGSVGLCIGCSLITFIEFLVFAIEVLVKYTTFSKPKQGKITKTTIGNGNAA